MPYEMMYSTENPCTRLPPHLEQAFGTSFIFHSAEMLKDNESNLSHESRCHRAAYCGMGRRTIDPSDKAESIGGRGPLGIRQAEFVFRAGRFSLPCISLQFSDTRNRFFTDWLNAKHRDTEDGQFDSDEPSGVGAGGLTGAQRI
jgi:hypothetical protein